MKFLIVGSRNIDCFDISAYVPEDVSLIISGGARGVDSIAEKYSNEHRISKLILRPDYKRYGKAAPIKRNEEMVRLADEVLVIWDGKSRGTLSTINFARKHNIPCRVITVQKEKSESEVASFCSQ